MGNYRIRTYLNGNLRDDEFLNSNLANVGLLPGDDRLSVSISTMQSFDEIRLTITQGVGLINNTDVYYAFVRLDDDMDGVPNCIDKCPGGNDNILNSFGQPLGCNDECTVNAGFDQFVCPPATTAFLPAAGPGQTWTSLPGNPTGASVSSSGEVTGLTEEGEYFFQLSDGVCTETVTVVRQEGAIETGCDVPLVAPDAELIDNNSFGICLICDQTDAENIVDGDGSTFYEVNSGIGLANNTFVIVRDSSTSYPVGTRTGYVISTPNGLLNSTLLGSLGIRLRLNGVVVQTATGSSVLAANAIGSDQGKFRVSIVSTEEFNEIEFFQTGTLTLLSSLRIFNAFVENAAECPEQSLDVCIATLSAASNFNATISAENSGFTGGVACALCSITSLSHLIDGNTSTFATMMLPVSALSTASISGRTNKVMPSGTFAGFRIRLPDASLIDLDVLNSIRIRTFLGGALQEDLLASATNVNLVLVSDGGDAQNIFLATSADFDEIQISLISGVEALTSLDVFSAFVVKDSDSDGIADCFDKCCEGDDSIDSNGNGTPDSCEDAGPIAVNDLNIMVPTNGNVDILVLENDSWGINGPGSNPIQVITMPLNGTVVVNDNGTPGDVTDDFVVYTPDNCFAGEDEFTYGICDSEGICDTAMVTLTVEGDFAFEITCPEDQMINTGPGACLADFMSTRPIPVIDCNNIQSYTLDISFGDGSNSGQMDVIGGEDFNTALPVGTNTLSYILIREDNEEITCLYNVEVMDQEPPILICLGDIDVEVNSESINGDDCGFATVGAELDPMADDNCPGLMVTHNYTSAPSNTTLAGASFPLNDPNDVMDRTCVVFTATDANGNISTCEVCVRVVDSTPPMITCISEPTVEVNVNANGINDCSYTVAGDEFDAIAEDNCLGVSLVHDYVSAPFDNTLAGASFPLNDPNNPFDRTCVVFTATDINGNESTCEACIRVVDNSPPMVTCVADITVDSNTPGMGMNACSFTQVGTDLDPEVEDNCQGILVTHNYATAPSNTTLAGASFPLNEPNDPSDVTCVVFTAIDDSGNMSTCEVCIRVVDNIPPVINCAADATVEVNVNAVGSEDCSYKVVDDEFDPEVSDNCSNANVTHNYSSAPSNTTLAGASFPLNDSNNPADRTCVVFTVVDDSGNESDCEVCIRVIDTTPPVINDCSEISMTWSEAEACDANVIGTDLAAEMSAQDNCDGVVEVVFAGIERVFEEACEGPNQDNYSAEFRFTATDMSGNISTCLRTVTLVYDAQPEFTLCQDITIGIDGMGSTSVDLNQFAMATADVGMLPGCEFLNDISYEINGSLEFECSDVGTHEIGVTATICTGANAVCMATITIVDLENPEFLNCMDRTINLSDINSCDPDAPGLLVRDQLVAASNCGSDVEITYNGILDVVQEVCEGPVPNQFQATYSYTAADDLGQTVDCQLMVTAIYDVEPEFVVCDPITIALDSDGLASVDLEDLAIAEVPAGMLPECDFLNTINYNPVGQVIYTCDDIGMNQLNVTASICTGASAVCSIQVTVVDETEPEIIGCEARSYDLSELGTCDPLEIGQIISQELIAIDDCDGDVEVVFSEILDTTEDPCSPSGDIFEATYRFTATDASGNVAICHIDVIVIYDVVPEFVLCDDITVTVGSLGETNVDISSFVIAEVNPTGLSGCEFLHNINYESNIPLSFDCTNAGTVVVDVTATLCTGATDVCTANITVEIDDTPEFLNCEDITISLTDLESCNQDSFGESHADNLIVGGSCDSDDFSIEYNGIVEIIQEACEAPDLGMYQAIYNYSAFGPLGFIEDCDLTISVEYDIDLEFTVCKDTTITLVNGVASVSWDEMATAEIPQASFELCDFLDNISYDQEGEIDFDCSDAGVYTYTRMATSCTGLEESCTFNVTIINDSVPLFDGCEDVTASVSEVLSCDPDDFGLYIAQNLSDDSGCDSSIEIVYDDLVQIEQEICSGNNLQAFVGVYRFIVNEGNEQITCELTGTLLYDVEPVFTICEPVDVMMEPDGQVTVNPSELVEVRPGGSDISTCGAWGEISLMPTGEITYDCNNIGVHIINVEARDCAGNQATCELMVNVIGDGDLQVICPSDITVDCSGSTDPFINPMMRVAEVMGVCEQTSGIELDFTDEIEGNLCEGSATILRTWFIVGSEDPLAMCTQTINVEGEDNLQVNIIPAIQNTDGFECTNMVRLMRPEISGSCSEIREINVEIDGVSGSFLLITDGEEEIDEPTFPAPGDDPLSLEFGSYIVTYSIRNACGTILIVNDTLVVEDNEIPFMICHDELVLGVGSHCDIRVPAFAFDVASFDQCSDITLTAARMSPSECYDPSERSLDFRPFVDFCCVDFGVDDFDRMVILRATDEVGNTNHCMVRVTVQDKVPPTLVCPPDVTVQHNGFGTGEHTMADRFGDIRVDGIDRRLLIENQFVEVGNNNGYLDGFISDNCITEVCGPKVFMTAIVPKDCETQSVIRIFEISDLGGSYTSCQQTITFEEIISFNPEFFQVYAQNTMNENPGFPENGPFESDLDPDDKVFPSNSRGNIRQTDLDVALWDIIWPADLMIETCVETYHPDSLAKDPDLILGARPYFSRRTSDLLSADFEDLNGTPIEGACQAIIRRWTVTDGCQPEKSWTWDQQIFVIDNTAPEIHADNLTLMAQVDCEDQASGTTELIVSASDNCSNSEFIWNWEVWLFGDPEHIISSDEAILSEDSLSITDSWPLTGISDAAHMFVVNAIDQCGNSSEKEFEFRVAGSTKLSVDCKQNLTFEILPGAAAVNVMAAQFDSGSFDDCTESDQLKFRIERADNPPGEVSAYRNIVFTCEDIGAVDVRLWVGNEVGEWAFCESTVNVIDLSGLGCDDFHSVVAGLVGREDDIGVEGVTIKVTDPNHEVVYTTQTDEDGFYSFNLPHHSRYIISPDHDVDIRNGLSTLDLILIQKHILGTKFVDSDYKQIASDVNRSGSITARDLLDIRFVLLGRANQFPNNKSWILADASYHLNGLMNEIKETTMVSNLEVPLTNLDFIAVKVGDVNNSALVNSEQLNRSVSRNNGLNLYTDDKQVVKGEEFILWLDGRDLQDAIGFQGTMKFDQNAMTFQNVEAGSIDFGNENFSIHRIDEGMISFSWHTILQRRLNSPLSSDLFGFRFKVTKTAFVNELIDIQSTITQSLVVTKAMEEVPLKLAFDPTFAQGVEEISYELFQNTPNPFSGQTSIGFNLPDATEATITIYDIGGRLIFQHTGDYEKGFNTFFMERNKLPETGTYYYSIHADQFIATKKMIRIE